MTNEKRLINATESEQYFRGLASKFIGSFTGDAYALATATIENAPTVDAVGVVHGRWIRRGNESKCSKCQFIYYSNHDDFNYCPNCGAKMDGDGNG